MAQGTSPQPQGSSQYGSATDLPTFQEIRRALEAYERIPPAHVPDMSLKIQELRQEVELLTQVVDNFYERLGHRNWIFHGLLNPSVVQALLADSSDATTAETRFIGLYRDPETLSWWATQLRVHAELRARDHQIQRARHHYEAGEFDSCVLQLITVMDGFVNDFEPAARKGLHARAPEDMTAWDSVVGHHLGLTHVMGTFTAPKYKRVDEEVFEVYRNGIVHGSVVNFDNVIVATKAWNLLFAVADWATATKKAAQPPAAEPTWEEIGQTVQQHAALERYNAEFSPTTVTPTAPTFTRDAVATRSRAFFEAWEHGRWGLVVDFVGPQLSTSSKPGEAIRWVKETLEQRELAAWTIESVAYIWPHTADVRSRAVLNGDEVPLRLRWSRQTEERGFSVPDDPRAAWRIAIWAPQRWIEDAD